MHRRIELPKIRGFEHDEVLRHWRWFRTRVLEIHGFAGLPTRFAETDGEIEVIERVHEDDPSFELQPAEFNFSSRVQTIRFHDGSRQVEILVSHYDLGNHFRFDYAELGVPVAKIHFLADMHVCYLDVDDSAPHFGEWERSCRD